MLLRSGVLVCLLAAIAQPAVQRLYVKERSDVAGGASFGSAGPYERIAATAVFRIDPKLKQNRGIVDVDLAPTDPEGLVEFTADVLILKPRDPAKGNGTALIDVPNRGRMLAISMFNRGSGSLDPQTAQELGDGFLMQQGFTVVSVGWQWDTPEAPGRLGLKAPRLRGNITGLVRGEFVPDKTTSRFSLGDRDHVPYPVADEKDPANRMTVSDGPGLPRREIQRAKWRFVDKSAVEIDGGCEPGKVYEVVYRGTGAVPVGLGFAAVRDMASFFKYGTSPFLLGDQPQFIKQTIGFGVSQTGRFLRHMLYQDFNEDEKGRKAVVGVWGHVAGAGRGGFNHRFAQPSRDAQPLLHYSWPVDMFPFTVTVMRDPITGANDGLLKRVTAGKAAGKAAPKVFYTNGSYEYWGRAASLIHTTPDGKSDVTPDAETRIYLMAGGQHGAGSLPLKRANTQNIDNPLDQRWAMRALLVAMNAWVKDGAEPPASVYPRIATGELVPARDVKYPSNVHAPKSPRVPHVLDFGSEPPKEGATYTVLLPQVDRDGNELGGVRMPELDVPLGIYTGWNLRAPSIGSPDRMIAFIGSFFPYSDAQKRYESKDAYLNRVREAAGALVARRFALQADVDKMVGRAGELWDAVAHQH
jgi:hypothetical protein